jgi:hypothetical protein
MNMIIARFRSRTAVVTGCLLGIAAALGVGCAPHDTSGSAPGGRAVRLPAANATFDYQLGGPYQPAPGVRVVTRDRTAQLVPGHYNICYVNAFQAQPDARDWWRAKHPDLLLEDDDGHLVIDEDWNEALLDVSTAARRAKLADIVGEWIDGCATKGFQAVEPDNLDSYERSRGRLTASHAAAFARLLADRAHAAGLAIGQKNATELMGHRKSIGFDFAVAEECGRYDECGRFGAAYANRVFVVEYTTVDYAKSCGIWGKDLAVVQRDRDLRPDGEPGHVFKSC